MSLQSGTLLQAAFVAVEPLAQAAHAGAKPINGERSSCITLPQRPFLRYATGPSDCSCSLQNRCLATMLSSSRKQPSPAPSRSRHGYLTASSRAIRSRALATRARRPSTVPLVRYAALRLAHQVRDHEGSGARTPPGGLFTPHSALAPGRSLPDLEMPCPWLGRR